jgi:hypothetical protein
MNYEHMGAILGNGSANNNNKSRRETKYSNIIFLQIPIPKP